VVDEADFRARCRVWRDAFPDADVYYAGKAFLTVSIARWVADEGLLLDVCTGGELTLALRAGFDPSRIALHGNNKSAEELERAIAVGVHRLVVDNFEEIALLSTLVTESSPLDCLVRVTPGVEAHTHEFVRTGGDNTKFGVPSRQLDDAMAALKAAPSLRFAGLHSHIGSQIYDADAFVENVRALVDLAARFHRAGLTSEKLIVGGGFGVQTDPNGEPTVPIPQTIAAIAAAMDQTVRAAGIPPVRVGIEPGRALIARAGTSIYTVMARKRQQARTFVVIDGGLTDNPRPALYQAHHQFAAVASGDASERVAICGRSCENDFMGDADVPANLAAGDLAVMCTAGAYTYSMASNYNRFAKPSVIGIEHGKSTVLARRETYEDILAADV